MTLIRAALKQEPPLNKSWSISMRKNVCTAKMLHKEKSKLFGYKQQVVIQLFINVSGHEFAPLEFAQQLLS